jgi:hypothetical protein
MSSMAKPFVTMSKSPDSSFSRCVDTSGVISMTIFVNCGAAPQ